jgi:hypothetical protein
VLAIVKDDCVSLLLDELPEPVEGVPELAAQSIHCTRMPECA